VTISSILKSLMYNIEHCLQTIFVLISFWIMQCASYQKAWFKSHVLFWSCLTDNKEEKFEVWAIWADRSDHMVQDGFGLIKPVLFSPAGDRREDAAGMRHEHKRGECKGTFSFQSMHFFKYSKDLPRWTLEWDGLLLMYKKL